MESVRIVQSIEMDTLVNRDGLLGRVRRVKGAMAVRLFDALIQMGGWYTNVMPNKKRRQRRTKSNVLEKNRHAFS